MRIVLTIAGSDNTGGAGIEADIKTCCHFGVYACVAITAVTAQNSRGVSALTYVGDDMLRAQLEKTLEVMRPDALKIGMLPDPGAVKTVADFITRHDLHNIVFDPVLAATSGNSLSGDTPSTARTMADILFPLVDLLTPNLPEADYFLQLKKGKTDIVKRQEFSADEQNDIAQEFMRAYPVRNLLLKGGHLKEDTEETTRDILKCGTGESFGYTSARINTRHTHGTGCALSSAIACCLAIGQPLPRAIGNAHEFLTEALKKGALHPIVPDKGPLCYF